MADPSVTDADLDARLAALCREHDVPGASLAILDGDEVIEAAAGVCNRRTGVEVTADTLFQIGSISKVYTTTLIMQLVDEGLVDLDAPAQTYIPELALAAADASAITVRMLLTHTSGIEGDHFDSFGRGDDCVEQYVHSLAKLGLAHPTGTLWSYCNSGFVVAGLIVERLRGTGWDVAVREHLLRPLGVHRTSVTLPEDVLLHRAALGHVSLPATDPAQPAKAWHLTRAISPAGIISAPARDVVAFAAMHMRGGRAADGTQVLSADSVSSMQQRHADVVPGSMASGWGLGWGLYDWGLHVLGHNGGTIGQLAYLRAVPERNVAVCLLTNSSPGGEVLSRALLGPLWAERWGIDVVELPVPAAPGTVAIDPARYCGGYERLGFVIEVDVAEDGRLRVTSTNVGALATPGAPPIVSLLDPIDDQQFITRAQDGGPPGVASFVEPDASGRFAYWFNGRLARRTT